MILFKYYKTVGNFSFFCKSVIQIHPLFRKIVLREVGNGESILFWFDIWHEDCPMYIQYPNLFAKAKNAQTVTLAQVYRNESPKIPLIRGASIALRAEKTVVINILTNLNLGG